MANHLLCVGFACWPGWHQSTTTNFGQLTTEGRELGSGLARKLRSRPTFTSQHLAFKRRLLTQNVESSTNIEHQSQLENGNNRTPSSSHCSLYTFRYDCVWSPRRCPGLWLPKAWAENHLGLSLSKDGSQNWPGLWPLLTTPAYIAGAAWLLPHHEDFYFDVMKYI